MVFTNWTMVFKIALSCIILSFITIVVGQFLQGEEDIVIINFDFDYAEFNKSLMLTQNELLERQKVLKKFMGQPAKVVKVSFVSQNKSRVSQWINVWWLSYDFGIWIYNSLVVIRRFGLCINSAIWPLAGLSESEKQVGQFFFLFLADMLTLFQTWSILHPAPTTLLKSLFCK